MTVLEGGMPVVAIVDGVKIAFYANEHPPAHFHATIAEHRAVIDICRPDGNRGVVARGEARHGSRVGRVPSRTAAGAFRRRDHT